MQPEERDIAYLWDMNQAALEISDFIRNQSLVEFRNNRQLRYAVERLLMIIGEAANRVSEEFKHAHPEIPWIQIIGQRNILAHEYGEIRVERLWIVAAERIPELISQLKPLIPPPPSI